jgi:L-malate glycosyltransferase
MNILILISSLNYGGAEKQAVLDANILSAEHNVLLGYFIKGPQEELVDRKVKLVRIKKDNYLATAFRLGKVIRTNQIEIIHASLFASMMISALSSMISDAKVFWHFHSHEYELPYINGQLYKWLGRYHAIKKILFVNTELKSFLKDRFKFPAGKTEVLYNSTPIKPSFEKKPGNSKCTIGYVGRLVELKRVHFLIECAEYLKRKGSENFQILIIGDGPERSKLEDLTKHNSLSKVVTFTGFQTDTGKYYDLIDIFALPSGEECLSMAAMDAGVKGIPVVAFDVGGNSEIVDPGKTGFIVNTKEEFFGKIYFLVTNWTIREKMGKAATVYCYDKFGEERHLEKLNVLYRDVSL